MFKKSTWGADNDRIAVWEAIVVQTKVSDSLRSGIYIIVRDSFIVLMRAVVLTPLHVALIRRVQLHGGAELFGRCSSTRLKRIISFDRVWGDVE
jgi:hypothetical protein